MHYKLISLILFLLCICETKTSIDHTNYIRSKSNHLVVNNKNDFTNDLIPKVFEKSVSGKERVKREVEFNLDADHEEGMGTDLAATLNFNIIKTENTRLDVSARYSKHFSDYGANGGKPSGFKVGVEVEFL
ncbi:uncharacterized protein LOC116344994 [Contarinia nasturtii]|uniref:uncharacterized protein LOC116344994 n=1 Tax=Contarinia nasturtii TaxID=265458 RepID=UPI0012D4716C|nr:uncharacterized protein LOC116344994 [Contarinia nasturtii]